MSTTFCSAGISTVKRSHARKHNTNEPVTFETVRRLAHALPGVEESTSYGTPAFKVRGKLFVRLHQDGESLVISVDFPERAVLMGEQPETFYITDHYLNYQWVLVRLQSVRADQLPDLLRKAWRRAAPKSLVAASHSFESEP
jgi:hypothetical protein